MSENEQGKYICRFRRKFRVEFPSGLGGICKVLKKRLLNIHEYSGKG